MAIEPSENPTSADENISMISDAELESSNGSSAAAAAVAQMKGGSPPLAAGGGGGYMTTSNHIEQKDKREWHLFIGNLTWWTTDAEITAALTSLGINDMLDVNFYDNKANGQSKGFCRVTLGSADSFNLCREKMAQHELHKQHPTVLLVNKQNHLYLDSQSGIDSRPYNHNHYHNHGDDYDQGGYDMMDAPPNMSNNHLMPPRPRFNLPPPGHRMMNGNRLPMPPRPMMMMQPPPPFQQMPPWQPPPVGIFPIPPSQPGLPMQNFPGAVSSNSSISSTSQFHDSKGNPLSETEFEEILQRNQTVMSTAIQRGVADAGEGNFGAAIETLVTAIGLIRQSKVSHDDRCHIFVGSLQDTLRGIEDKSYSSNRDDRRPIFQDKRRFSPKPNNRRGGWRRGGGYSDRRRRSRSRDRRDRRRSNSRDRHNRGRSSDRHRTRTPEKSRRKNRSNSRESSRKDTDGEKPVDEKRDSMPHEESSKKQSIGEDVGGGGTANDLRHNLDKKKKKNKSDNEEAAKDGEPNPKKKKSRRDRGDDEKKHKKRHRREETPEAADSRRKKDD